MNVLVEEQCLKDIAESIRKKGGLTTTYKPREMAVAIDNLQTGGSGCLVKIEQSANQKITATYKGKTYTNGDFFVLIGESFQTSITADNHYTAGTLNYNGTPLHGDITVRATQATEARKYKITIVQSAYQTITATYDGKNYTSTFYAYVGSRITFSVKGDADHEAGTLNYTVISSLSGDVTVSATQATKKVKSYKDKKAEVVKVESFYVYCKFTDGETFTFYHVGSVASIFDNSNLANFVKNNDVYLEYNGERICTFKKDEYAKDVKNIVKEIKTGDTITVRVV